MLSNYFTLLHTAKLLHRRFARSVIAQVYSQQKNTLSILLYAPEPHTITISCSARENYVIAKNADMRTRHNTVDLFPLLVDRHIESVFMSATDRIIYIRISGALWLCLEMFASSANAVLCDEHGTIVDVFLNKKELMSAQRELQLAEKEIGVEDIVPPADRFVLELTEAGDMRKQLKKVIPKFGSTLADEVLFRCSAAVNVNTGIGPSCSQTVEYDKTMLFNVTREIAQTILSLPHVAPCIYFEEQSPVCFSLMPLDHVSSYRSERYDDLFTGIQKFISFERSTSTLLQKKKELTSWCMKELKKAERTVRSVESDLAESSRGVQYELFGNLIMAHLHTITKGSKAAELDNAFSQNEKIIVPLDASLSPQKNAEKYFEKAKKAKIGREESQERLSLLKKRIALVEDFLEKILQIKDGFSLKNFLQSNRAALNDIGFMTDKEKEELPPFRIFAVDGGFTVYAGKNSANNDLLTFRFTKPNDIWFHARGSGGSHVVLKSGSAVGTPTKKAIEQAASIAAYYSKMKNAKHVPVAMTERKYIHKPKGAPAGTVAIDKEKVIFVQPVLPEKE